MTAVLAASILSVVAITTPMAFADESETETEQELKQKNVGSGESFNDNCGQNLIDSDYLPLSMCNLRSSRDKIQ